MPPPPAPPRGSPGTPFRVSCGTLLVCLAATAAGVEIDFEDGTTRWSLAASDTSPRLTGHAAVADAARTGSLGERVTLEAGAGSTLRLEYPLGAANVIDELRASVWVRANRPGIRLGLRVRLPGFVSARTGRAVEVTVPGGTSRQADRWELLEATDVGASLRRQLAPLRAEHGSSGELAGAVATHLVLDLFSAPGHYDLSIDDLRIEGLVPVATGATAATAAGRPAVRPAAFSESVRADDDAGPASGLTRGVLEVAGAPFFPRSLDHNGEPLETVARLGFNCVRLAAPATADLLEEARRAGVWLICPPPELPDVDIRDLDSLPTFSRRWDRVLFWDMGAGLAETDVESLAERARRVRTCDSRGARPLIASADSGLRSISRHVDMVVARRTVLGTSLELTSYASWLRERPRLARPGTPVLAALSSEVDPRTAGQAASLSGVGGQGLAVDPESLRLAALAAVSAGVRGLLFTSTRRIDGDDHESTSRAAAAVAVNTMLRLLEPWGAAGRFSASAQASDPEVQAAVLEAARARMVVAWRSVQGAQIVARRYHGDIPRNAQPLTVLVPGVPEAHQAWEVSPGGLKPVRHKRVTGGISLTLDSFRSHALILLSGDPAVTAHLQERVRGLLPLELSASRALAQRVLADDAALLARVSPAALGTLPVAAMLAEAHRDLERGDAATGDPRTAIEAFERAGSIGGQVERLLWERGVVATGSMVASPLSTSDATLAEHWRFIEALAATVPGSELLPGGGMDRIEDLAAAGWRHFALEQQQLRTAVAIDRSRPASGGGSLVLTVEPTNAEEQPVVVETPPLWVTTPPVSAPSGRLLEIQARVWVPRPVKGSVDGLLVFDSFGGPALAERVGVTPAWRRLVLYRIAPADTTTPLTVTFALTGMGEARIDDVSIKVLDRGQGVPATVVSTGPQSGGSAFPQPGDLLTPAPAPAPAAAAGQPPRSPPQPPSTEPAPTAPQWPGMNLEWPKLLPFGASPNAPPPGPGGGTIDPFKRARAAPQ